MAILVSDVNPRDKIIIRTDQSEYHFYVTNPKAWRGVLTGGRLGQRFREAFFAGVVDQHRAPINGVKGLETGTRACFFLAGRTGVDRLTTSVITQLICLPSPTPTVWVAAA